MRIYTAILVITLLFLAACTKAPEAPADEGTLGTPGQDNADTTPPEQADDLGTGLDTTEETLNDDSFDEIDQDAQAAEDALEDW